MRRDLSTDSKLYELEWALARIRNENLLREQEGSIRRFKKRGCCGSYKTLGKRRRALAAGQVDMIS